MCLTKKRFSKPKIAEADMYLIKTSKCHILHSSFMSYYVGFVYRRDIIYKKNWWKKLLAKFKSHLESEVFHVWNHETSKAFAKEIRSHKCYYDIFNHSIFMVPKGTLYYEGNIGEYGVFSIEYLGPLTEENKHLVLNQQ